MSINIPEYYKSFFLSQSNLLDVQNKMPKKLSEENVINVQDIPQDKLINRNIDTTNIDFSKYDYKLIESSPNTGIMVINKDLNPIDYYKFQDCVNSMKELNTDQITTLRNAIITSTEEAVAKLT